MCPKDPCKSGMLLRHHRCFGSRGVAGSNPAIPTRKCLQIIRSGLSPGLSLWPFPRPLMARAGGFADQRARETIQG